MRSSHWVPGATSSGPLQWVIGAFYSDTERLYSQRLPTPGYDAFTNARFGAGTAAAVLPPVIVGKTCVPATTNCGVFWARRSHYRRPGVAVIEFLEPIPPGLSIPAFMARLEAVVEAESNRLMREAGYAGPLPEPAPPAA